MSAKAWPQGTGRITLDSTDSTNAEALRRAPQLAGPAWILAAAQTAGRGRRARPWVSPLGNFYGSYVMRPKGALADVALRSFIVSLALYDAFAAVMGQAGLALKWPNDVLMNGGKVAGILLESQARGPEDFTLVIGIGVNLIGHPPVEAVEQGAVTPVSLLSETGLRLTPAQFLDHLAPAYDHWERVFVTEGFEPIRQAWLSRAARLGERIRTRTGTQERFGIFETIDPAGNLVLKMDQHTVAIPAAEVFFE